jgi:hypothetical protein
MADIRAAGLQPAVQNPIQLPQPNRITGVTGNEVDAFWAARGEPASLDELHNIFPPGGIGRQQVQLMRRRQSEAHARLSFQKKHGREPSPEELVNHWDLITRDTRNAHPNTTFYGPLGEDQLSPNPELSPEDQRSWADYMENARKAREWRAKQPLPPMPAQLQGLMQQIPLPPPQMVPRAVRGVLPAPRFGRPLPPQPGPPAPPR